ncbi:hypothetical protein ACEPPU_24140 [Priestia aryabhattai]|uniref:phage scaffolding protein n=1 Tax=Priestia aryabhattai TaxID=412384 RepID=UPI0035ABD1E5
MFAKPLFQRAFKPLVRLDIQYFAEGEGDDDDDQDTDDDQDDTPNLAEMLKDPVLKKQYQALLKTQLGKRMKKFEGVDVDEYRQLKEMADKKKQQDKDSDDDDKDNLKSELKDKQDKLLRAERREKRAAVKEFAVDQGVNPKLLSRLIDMDSIELDDDGEPENLDELFEELQDEFPEYFKAQDDSEDEEEETKSTKSSYYSPGPRQKTNKKPKGKDGTEAITEIYEQLKAQNKHK